MAREGGPAGRASAAVGELLPGLLLAGALGGAAHLLAAIAFPYALTVGFEVPLAMLAGLIAVNAGAVGAAAAAGIRFAARHVLALGIILLGLRLNLQSVAAIGIEAFALVAVTIACACAFAVALGRRLGVQRRVALLIGVGSSICGNSAILAAAPVVRADQREISFAVATITVFGTFAVFAFPLAGHALGLDVLTFGMWAGAAVPDTAQTIASGAAYSTVARDVATVVKLVRNVLMAPLVIVIAWWWSRRAVGEGIPAEEARRGARRAFPYFLIGFLLMAVARSTRLVNPETVADVDVVTRGCFVVALAALGLQTRLGHIRSLGARPFLLGLSTFSLLAGLSLALVLALGLGPARTAVAGGIDPRQAGAWTSVCERGRPPAFAGAFVALAQRYPDEVGRPLACARGAGGTTVQRTSRGRATLSPDGRVTFSDGRRAWALSALAGADRRTGRGAAPAARLRGRVMATGIPGAGALAVVGAFHPGGPIHDKREFAAATRPGRVLDPARLLVASGSNFGAPRARADLPTGSVVSLATGARAPLRLPPRFAAAGTQAAALGGAVRLYTAQSPPFFNRDANPGARTARLPAVADPRGISINNAFGRPWFASATGAAGAAGLSTVVDPDGRPLEDPPSDEAGGVFAGTVTNRARQLRPGGLSTAAVGNALLGASPDTTNRAVFAVATADGALAQVHVEEGVDGLAPPGTLAPLRGPDAPRRVGMAFNWVPDRFLYVTDPVNDAVLQLRLDDDFRIFRVAATRRLRSALLDEPVDLAPAVPEIANPAFASNTTLAGGADLYVVNRGSGTIVRLRQDGRIRAVAQVVVPGAGPLGADLLNGIAVSSDAATLWVSVTGDHPLSGSVIELPAFGAPR